MRRLFQRFQRWKRACPARGPTGAEVTVAQRSGCSASESRRARELLDFRDVVNFSLRGGFGFRDPCIPSRKIVSTALTPCMVGRKLATANPVASPRCANSFVCLEGGQDCAVHIEEQSGGSGKPAHQDWVLAGAGSPVAGALTSTPRHSHEHRKACAPEPIGTPPTVRPLCPRTVSADTRGAERLMRI